MKEARNSSVTIEKLARHALCSFWGLVTSTLKTMKAYPYSSILQRVLWIISLLFLCHSAQANTYQFRANLSGPAESPTNSSPGMGLADVFFDDVAQTMVVKVSFWDLMGVTTAAHIHAATALPGEGTAGVATETPFFENFPIGVSSGSYENIFDLTMASSFNSAFVTANGGTLASASLALENSLLAGTAYFNIHTDKFRGGEIRGFLYRAPDSSATVLLLGFALSGLAFVARVRGKMRA